MKWGKKVIKTWAMVYKLHGITFLCAQKVRESRQKELSVSLLTSGCVNHVPTKIILWWKGHITKTATCKGVLLAAAPHCRTWAFRCEPPSPCCASEILLKSLVLKSSRWVQKGILKWISSIKVAYVGIVFILAHGVLKCNLKSMRMINIGFDRSS